MRGCQALILCVVTVIICGAAGIAQTPTFENQFYIGEGLNTGWNDPEPTIVTNGIGDVVAMWHVELAWRRSLDQAVNWDATQRYSTLWSGDPMLCANHDGTRTVYIGGMVAPSGWRIDCSRSSDGGGTLDFTRTVVQTSEGPDRPWIASRGSKIYMVYATGGSNIWFRRSDDMGNAWGGRISVAGGYVPGGISLGAGQDVYCVYETSSEFKVAYSRNDGQTWTVVPTSALYMPKGSPYDFYDQHSQIISDTNGNVVVAWIQGGSYNGKSVRLLKLGISHDHGATWTVKNLTSNAELDLFTAKTFATNSFFRQTEPWFAVDPYGQFHLVWYDNREGRSSTSYDWWNCYYVFSTDKGDTWSPAVRVSKIPGNNNPGFTFSSSRGGNRAPQDFIGVDADKEFVYPCWADNQAKGVAALGDVYAARAPIAKKHDFPGGIFYFSIPVAMTRTDPAQWLGFIGTQNGLSYFDPIINGERNYGVDFTNTVQAQGYKVLGTSPTTYFIPGFDTAAASFEAPIPGTGIHWVGNPYNRRTLLRDISVRNNDTGEVRSMVQDYQSGNPWIDWGWRELTPNPGSTPVVPPTSPDYRYIPCDPWKAYSTRAYLPNLTLIFPK